MKKSWMERVCAVWSGSTVSHLLLCCVSGLGRMWNVCWYFVALLQQIYNRSVSLNFWIIKKKSVGCIWIRVYSVGQTGLCRACQRNIETSGSVLSDLITSGQPWICVFSPGINLHWPLMIRSHSPAPHANEHRLLTDSSACKKTTTPCCLAL